MTFIFVIETKTGLEDYITAYSTQTSGIHRNQLLNKEYLFNHNIQTLLFLALLVNILVKTMRFYDSGLQSYSALNFVQFVLEQSVQSAWFK